MADSEWGFTLQPASEGARTWRLRAPTEELRLQWSRRLVLLTAPRPAPESLDLDAPHRSGQRRAPHTAPGPHRVQPQSAHDTNRW